MAFFRKEATGLYHRFMSQENVDLIQDRLSNAILLDTGYAIGKQSQEILESIMEGVYQDNFLGHRSEWEELNHMNGVVLDIVIPQVKAGVNQYWHFLDLQSVSPDAQPLPEPTRSWRSFNF